MEPNAEPNVHSIGLMSPGDMGQALAIQFKAIGFNVYTALGHRSERTRALAREAGLTDLGTMDRLVSECDLVLSVLNPGAAVAFAHDAAQALRATGSRALIVDCNAIAPDTVDEISGLVQGAGGRFLDASLIGPPPRGEAKVSLYVSGPGARILQQLAGPRVIVQVIGERQGDASALKMCYGAVSKGSQALWLQVLIAARHLGVEDLLDRELRRSHADPYAWALGQFPVLPPKAYRWVPEMLEIAKTFADTAITPKVFEGAADIYRFVAATALGQETPENRDRARTGQDVVRSLSSPPPT